jgi:hypothetical protein
MIIRKNKKRHGMLVFQLFCSFSIVASSAALVIFAP